MPPPDVAVAHYRTQQQLAAKAVTTARRLWTGMRPADFDGSWETVGPRMRALLTLAQARAAVDGVAYVTHVLDAQGTPGQPIGEVNPAQLAGTASSGGQIDALLYAPVITAKQQVAEGADGATALQQARTLLDGIMQTQVADAGRVATGIAVVNQANVPGYVRMLVRPSCARCVILAGKTFHWNRGFARHPRCDCIHIPVAEDTFDDLTTDPVGYFRSLSAEQQDATFGKDGAQAIRDGSDMGQVVNARKGIQTASAFGRKVTATTQGARRRLRLMPEQIYQDATSRDDAIRLLRLHGYIT